MSDGSFWQEGNEFSKVYLKEDEKKGSNVIKH